jgi:hypothetical protein
MKTSANMFCCFGGMIVPENLNYDSSTTKRQTQHILNIQSQRKADLNKRGVFQMRMASQTKRRG